jgi:hypothetical protein
MTTQFHCRSNHRPESKEASPKAQTSTREKQDFFSLQCHIATLDHSDWVERPSSGLGPPQNQGSATWITASAAELPRKGCESVIYRKKQSNIANYYSTNGDLVHCKDVFVLMKELTAQPAPEQWRLFIDSSKFSLKPVLLHNENKHPSIPLFHVVHTIET